MNKAPQLVKVVLAFLSLSGFAQVAEMRLLEEQAEDNLVQLRSIEAAFAPLPVDSPDKDTTKLKYPLKKDKKPGDGKSHSLDLDDPPIIKSKTVYDTASGEFKTVRTLGDSTVIGDNEYTSFDKYLENSNDEYLKSYFRDRSMATNFTSNSRSDLLFKTGAKGFEDIFGSDFVDIKPQGSAELIFMGEINKVENPAWSVRQQRNGQFKFDQKIRLNVLGKIGDRVNLNLNYDTEANFEFDNLTKLNYQGKEDDIIKTIEAGDISLPLQGSLIQGSQRLFGLKTKLQFGRLSVTSVISNQNTERSEITVDGGAQKTAFNIPANEYDANRHFFLSQYFKNHYNEWASNSPLLMSPVNITRVEVWVTNYSGRPQETRNMVSLMDLGEHGVGSDGEANVKYDNGIVFTQNNVNYEGPDNEANTLYDVVSSSDRFRNLASVGRALEAESNKDPEFSKGVDYVLISNVRKLQESEFTVHKNFGYISLNSPIPANAVLAVSFEYTVDGRRHQVGEFSRDIPADPNKPNVLFLKMLKSEQIRTDLPVWDLMMKNIYSLGSNRIEEEDFRFEVIYADDESGADLPYIPEPSEKKLNGTQLIRVLGLDKVDRQMQPRPDGVFDFIDGLTIDVQNGRIIFPVLEPFGEFLYKKFESEELADDYAYLALYDSIQATALQETYLNKFFLKGFYKGSSSEYIPLNSFNVQQGSVKVTAGGVELVENQDYRVDYTLGRVKILNDAILNSGQQIKVSHESTTLFSQLNKALYGTRLDYRISDDLSFGGTLLHLRERPLTPKVNVGDEPLKNTIWGLDGRYRTDSRFLTKMVNRIPFIETKEESEISLSGEFAHLIPGSPRIIGQSGTSYIDDFEGSEVPYDLRLAPIRWTLASTPQGQKNLFPNATTSDGDLSNNYGRAKLAWYILDPLFYRNNSFTPGHLRQDVRQLSNHYVREVRQTEVFPQRQLATSTVPTNPTLDLAYFPSDRGPYNYDYASLNEDGTLKNPSQNWAGLMRRIETPNFEAANIQYIEFWLMDPFIYDDDAEGGEFYINLGQISEDVLQDNKKSFENGLPTDNSDEDVIFSGYGRVPSIPNINQAFNMDQSTRKYQDVGLDGIGDARERSFFKEEFLDQIAAQYGQNSIAYQLALEDPSGDNYHYFRGDSLDRNEISILNRYKNFNNTEGNSPVPNPGGDWPEGFPTSAKITPDDEDINGDFTLNTTEAYYQYKVNLAPNQMRVGQNYITDVQESTVSLPNGRRETVKWYQFKIPIFSYQRKVGPIAGFKSIQFMRMFLTGFEDSIICRFAQLQLVRGDWREYLFDLDEPGEVVTNDPNSNTVFDISTVNIEENSKRDPIPYVLPPGIAREVNNFTINQAQQNEQSLSLAVCDLADGDAKAVFKTTDFDVRQFKRINMFTHAEGRNLRDNELTMFLRVGTDLSGHYYEYEIPLKVTPDGTGDPDLVWPEENEINLLLEEFYRAKLSRDSLSHPLTQPFSRLDRNGRGKITVLGNPDLSNLRVVMIGVRNPAQGQNIFDPDDDGLAKCGEIWVNELRLTEFDKQGGWAANARATAKLADFGQINLAGQRRTIGFGGIEQTLLERSQEDVRGFDVQSSFALEKFFPEKTGIKLPMHYDYSQKNVRPRFNPLQPDVLLSATVASMTADNRRDLLDKVETIEIRRSLNFINVSKKRTNPDKKPMPWDISNFGATYKFTEVIKSDIFTAYDSTRNYTGILTYAYGFNSKPIQPFKKLRKYKALTLLSDFNFNYLPSNVSFQGTVNRRYNSLLFRNNDDIESIVPPNYNKTFHFDRNYNLRYNLTKALRLNYTASARSIIDEPRGPLNTVEKRDSVWENFKELGRSQNFTQSINVNYALPIDKLPLMDWVKASGDYKGGYTWLTAPPAADSLGNTISNSANYSVNGQLNFVQLYNKSRFLQTINSNRSNVDRIRKNRERKLKMKEMEDKKNGVVDVKPGEDEDEEEGDEEEEDDLVNETFIKVMEGFLRFLMMARNANINYSVNDGTVLPGFMPQPEYIGNDFDLNAPGLPFAFGSQTDIRQSAAENGWITTEPGLLKFFNTTHTENLTANATLEPLSGFRINVDFSRRLALNLQENFRNIDTSGGVDFQSLGTLESGNFSMSFNSIRTAFLQPVTETDSTMSEFSHHPLVEAVEDSRFAYSEELARQHGNPEIDDSTGYYKGFGPFQQEVLINAFLNTLSGNEGVSTKSSPFWDIPLPNWRISYNGLSRIKSLKKIFRTVNINHTYRSTYTVSNFTSALDYDEDRAQQAAELEDKQNFLPQYQIQQVAVAEQFAPLIGVDVNWKNNWTTKLEYARSRTMALNFTNYQLQEMYSKTIVVGIGYRTKELPLPFKYKGKKYVLENDFNFRTDISIRENRQTLWFLDDDVARSANPNDEEEDDSRTVSGQRLVNIAPTIDYKINDNLNLRIFYTRNVTIPFISQSYPRKNTTFGFSLRYTLSQ